MYKKFNKKRKIFFKEIGLEAFSIIFATIYFILNSCYKLYMSTRYGIPYNFFSLDLSFLTIATLLFIITPLLAIKLSCFSKNDINSLSKKKKDIFLFNVIYLDHNFLFFYSIY